MRQSRISSAVSTLIDCAIAEIAIQRWGTWLNNGKWKRHHEETIKRKWKCRIKTHKQQCRIDRLNRWILFEKIYWSVNKWILLCLPPFLSSTIWRNLAVFYFFIMRLRYARAKDHFKQWVFPFFGLPLFLTIQSYHYIFDYPREQHNKKIAGKEEKTRVHKQAWTQPIK